MTAVTQEGGCAVYALPAVTYRAERWSAVTMGEESDEEEARLVDDFMATAHLSKLTVSAGDGRQQQQAPRSACSSSCSLSVWLGVWLGCLVFLSTC
eukprot:COSAG02_NODE_670_length_18676_cov_29.852029_6_plen_96_part_00